MSKQITLDASIDALVNAQNQYPLNSVEAVAYAIAIQALLQIEVAA